MLESKIFFENDKVKIITDDVLTTNLIEVSSVDLIVTSPPYNVDIKYNSHRDDISYPGYLDFTQKWVSRCFE